MRELTDEEVFGTAPLGELSDAEVFGGAPAPSLRQIQAGETARRAGTSFLHNMNAYAAAPVVGVAQIFDYANQALGLREGEAPYTQMLGDRFVVPSLERVNEASIDPRTETAGPIGDVLIPVAGELGKATPDLLMGMGLSANAPKRAIEASTPAIRAVATRLADESVAGAPAGFRRAAERQQELVGAGVDPIAAVPRATASGVMTAAEFALPASVGSAARSLPARVASRGVQGAGLGTSAGLSAQQAENLMAPESLQQDVFTPENIVPQLVLNALFGQMGPRLGRTGVPDRARLGYDRLERAGLEPMGERVPYEPQPILDPNAAVKEVGEALFRTEPEAPVAPDFRLIPMGEEAPINMRPAPDVSETPAPVAPDWTTEGIAGRFRRTFDEPPIEPADSPAVRIAQGVENSTDRIEPNVPMRILHTIGAAARDSGLESRITPRIVSLDDGAAPARAMAPERAGVQPERPKAPQTPLPLEGGPRITTERPPEVIPAGQRNAGGEATPKVRDVAERPKRAGSTFLRAVRAAGGLDSGLAGEIGGDVPMVLNRRMPGLLRRGGMSEDALLEWAQQNGYLTAADVARADADGTGGAMELAKDLVRRAMRDEDVLTMAEQDAAIAREAEADRERADFEHEQRMESDPEYRAEQERLDREDMEAVLAENELPPTSEEDVDLVQRASQLDEVAVERLAQQAEGGAISDEQFMEGVRRIVDGKQSEETGASGASADEAPRGEAGQPVEGRPTLELERPTEAGLLAKDAERQRADEARSRVEKAPPAEDFTLTGSDRPADEAAARGQDELFNPDKASGGGTLYGGLPLDKVADALKWAFGDVKAWHDSIGRLAQDIRSMVDRVPSPEGNPVGRFFRAVFDSASGDMRSVLKKNPSKTAQWVIDQFHTEAGSDRVAGEIYSSAVNGWTNTQLTRFDKAVDGLKTQELEQVAALVRNPSGIRPGSKVHNAAKEVRKLLDDALKYMRDAGVEIGEVRDGYYPREFDMRAVMRDTAGFIKAAAQAFRENGMAPKDAEAAAKQLHDGMVFGESGSVFRTDRGSPQAPFLKGRVFGKQVDSGKHPLNAFLMHDPSQAIPIYLERAAKRAEIARRFGDNFEKWEEIEKKVIAEGGGPVLEKLRDYVTLAARLKSPGVSNFALRAASVARTWGALMFLEKATLSSLTEFIVPAIRSGNPIDVARSFRNTISDLVGKTQGAEQRRAFAEDLGIIAARLSDQVSAARFSGGEPVSMLESKILAKYFRRTGLTQWTDATFVSAADLGRVFIRRLAKELEGGGGKLNDRYLAELGVPKDRAQAFAKFVVSKNDGMLMAGDLQGPMGDLYRSAIRRFAQQSIMRPDATLRPGWMAHPIGSVVGQLQSFNYAFFENVLKRTGRLAKEAVTGSDYTMLERARLVTPMLMLPMLTAAAYAIGEARDAAFGDPERRKQETQGQKLLKAASRGTPIAPLDPLLNYASSARYQRSAADNFAGPVLGTAGRGMDAARQVALNNTPRTNTAERQAAKAAYDIFIEPTINLMLTASPVTLAAAAATQAAGSGRTREKFVSAVAGPAKKSPPRPRYTPSR
jgi:hypothetical protein